jgi:hypothetical protein
VDDLNSRSKIYSFLNSLCFNVIGIYVSELVWVFYVFILFSFAYGRAIEQTSRLLKANEIGKRKSRIRIIFSKQVENINET